MATYIFRPPIVLRSWQPDPQGVAVRAQNNVWVNPLNLYFQPAATSKIFRGPLVFRNWPAPRSVSLYTWINASPIQFPTSGAPTVNSDYPNPRGPQRAVGLLTWTSKFHLSPTPFSIPDYPNPRGASPSVELRTWLSSFQLELVPSPFRNADWPNPRGAADVVAHRTFINSQLPTIAGQPIRSVDWPNPLRLQFNVSLLTIAQNYLPYVPVPPIPPEPYIPHGGGFGGGWNYSDGWGYNSNKRIRKPGEPIEPPDADDIRELILDAIGRPRPKRVPIQPIVLLPPNPQMMAMIAQGLAQAEIARMMEQQDEQDVEMLLLADWP